MNTATSVTDWLRANTHRLRTLDPSDMDFADLEPLREIVGDARVVAIGESTHRVHEFYDLRHRLIRFLVAELGFTAFVMESGFPEGMSVNDWIHGGPGDLDHVLSHGITYQMGKCAEMRDHLEWMRSYNATHDRRIQFYGMDIPDSSASTRPSIEAGLALLDDIDPDYAAAVRRSLMPLYDYLPADRTGLAWQAPALHAYMGLEAPVRYEITARINDFVERFQAMRVVYSERSDAERLELVSRCLATARHADAFHAAMAAGASRTYEPANMRDSAMAENVDWILDREERIIVVAANGHIQRWPFWAPPIYNDKMTMLGEHLAASLGNQLVVIASAIGGGNLWQHRQDPEKPLGHARATIEEIETIDPHSLDALLSTADLPLHMLDLRNVPDDGPIADRFAAVTTTMNGPQPQPIDPMAAYDAVVYIDKVTPWHTWLPLNT